MNEQLKELEAQATVWHCDQGRDVSWLDTEKFAELIIKGCAEQLCDQKFRNADNDSKILVGQGLILNHFGVKE